MSRLAGRWFDAHREKGHFWFRFAGFGMGWASYREWSRPRDQRWQSDSSVFIGSVGEVWFFMPWQREAIAVRPSGVWVTDLPDGSVHYQRITRWQWLANKLGLRISPPSKRTV